MKKRKWKYWAGAFLLAAGLLAGCGNGEPPAARSRSQEMQKEESRAEETVAEENGSVEEGEGSIAQGEDGETKGNAAQEADGESVESIARGTDGEKEGSTVQAADGGSDAGSASDKMPDGMKEDAFPAGESGTGAPEGRAEDTETAGEEGEPPEKANMPKAPPEERIAEDGTYTSKEEVAEYLDLYGHLPDNFITKKEAKALGWVSSEGNLGEVAPGKSIGGDYFGNFEGNLPEKKGREYHECDIDSDGGYRGAKRIVYSNDGLIYYTEDHYNTFELLYGEE